MLTVLGRFCARAVLSGLIPSPARYCWLPRVAHARPRVLSTSGCGHGVRFDAVPRSGAAPGPARCKVRCGATFRRGTRFGAAPGSATVAGAGGDGGRAGRCGWGTGGPDAALTGAPVVQPRDAGGAGRSSQAVSDGETKTTLGTFPPDISGRNRQKWVWKMPKVGKCAGIAPWETGHNCAKRAGWVGGVARNAMATIIGRRHRSHTPR